MILADWSRVIESADEALLAVLTSTPFHVTVYDAGSVTEGEARAAGDARAGVGTLTSRATTANTSTAVKRPEWDAGGRRGRIDFAQRSDLSILG